MNRSIIASLALALAGFGPVSCNSEPEAPAAQSTTSAIASDPDAPAGIVVMNGRLALPAVSGNPGALYFTARNSGDADMHIVSASVTGAGRAMFHETVSGGGQSKMAAMLDVRLPARGELVLAPGGMHVMAMQLDENLVAGGRTEATLTFATGDKVSFPVEIVAPGMAGEAS